MAQVVLIDASQTATDDWRAVLLNMVITGTALLTAAGPGVASTWNGMAQRRSFFGSGPSDPSRSEELWPRALVVQDHIVWPDDDPWWANNKKYANGATQMAVAIARAAIDAAGRASDDDAARSGVVITIGGGDEEAQIMPKIFADIADEDEPLATLLYDEVPDYTYVRGILSQAGQFVAQVTGFRGSNVAVYPDGAAGGMGALDLAGRLLASGELDRVIVVGVSAPASPATLVVNDQIDPLGSSPQWGKGPFDGGRTGAFVGTGAAAIVLETEASAERRGKSTRIRLADCRTVTGGDRQEALATALDLIVTDADRPPALWWAHGAGSPKLDAEECSTIWRRVGPGAPVTSSKGTIGNAFECSALIDVVLAVESLELGRVPPIGLLETPDAKLDPIDLVTGVPRDLADASTAIVTSLGHRLPCAGAAMITRDRA